MQADSKAHWTISVRELVEFVLRSGDLGAGDRFVGSNRAQQGTRGHRRLQELRPANYEREQTVSYSMERAGFNFTVQGRIDGVQRREAGVLEAEIKTVMGKRTGGIGEVGCARVYIYGFMYV